jgi:CRP/FNR family cyclic AMP-dependent transcriptional regulator
MPQTTTQQLEQTGLFRDFDSMAKQHLVNCSHSQAFSDGEIIYQIGDEATALYGVLAGAVKLLGEDSSGKFCLFGLTTPGRWFGDSSALDGHPRGQTAIAAGNTKVIKLLRSDLLQLLDRQPELYRHFISVFCLRLRQAGKIFEDQAFLPVSVRLAKLLLRLHKVRNKYGIKLSQEELAASLGVTRQSISRVLKIWQKDAWINISYGNVEIHNEAAMQALLTTQSSKYL